MVEHAKVKLVGHKAVECKFCGHFYIEPCDKVKQVVCSNIKLKETVTD